MNAAPLALFAFNRPDHLTRCLEALRRNPEAACSALHLFCDGARHAGDQPGVEAVRRIARGVSGFASVTVVEQPENRGLAGSVIEGVGSLLALHERLIVLEDDLEVSAHFLAYMNDALALYDDAPSVASVHGYIYPIDAPVPETFFLRGADCWGWATWARAWQVFNPDGADLLRQLRTRHLTHAFDLDGAYPYTRMLEDQVAGRNASWAVRWHASCFLKDMLTLYPGRSLVQNIGNDASGTHCAATDRFTVEAGGQAVRVERIPLIEDAQAREAFARFLRAPLRDRLTGPLRRVGARIRKALT